ncbi:hypothetical protein ACF0H5_005103 [Mactra antiquata]
MVRIVKDILYTSIADVDQQNCYLDLYLPNDDNNSDLCEKYEQCSIQSSRRKVEDVANQNSDNPEQTLTLEDYHKNFDSYKTEGFKTSPKINSNNGGLPFVLFFHGGGWRRGGRAAWKHYLYFDVNFLVAFLQHFVGTYDNVGRTLASNDIPCAIVSYPLTEASWLILLVETFLSYLQCILFVALFSIPTVGLFTLYGHTSHHASFSSWYLRTGDYDNYYIVKTLFLVIVLLTNIVTSTIFIVKRSEFGFRVNQIVCYTLVITVAIATAISTSTPLLCLAISTLVINQAVIFSNRYKRSGSGYEAQVTAVAEAVLWAKKFSQESAIIDDQQLFLMGHSAGGHLATLSALDESILTHVSCAFSDLKGIISLSGVYDLQCLNKPFLRPAYLYPTFGHSSDGWTDASPEHQAKKISDSRLMPKFLLLCAEKDFFLKPQSYQFSQTLDEMNLQCKHVEIPGTNHFTIITNIQTTDGSPLSYVIDFINK